MSPAEMSGTPRDGSGRGRGLVVNPKALEAERKRNMKTYCKHLVVSDEKKIFDAITGYMHDKYRKGSSVRFYANYSDTSQEYVKENLKPGTDFWIRINKKLAADMAFHIRNRSMKEHLEKLRYGQPMIRYTKINDKGSGKERILGLEVVLMRLYEVVTEKASEPMFNAKIGIYQCASIKGKGQNFGKKAVKKWLSGDVEGTKYNAKADIKKCYPSIPHKNILELLHRDLRKSEELLYMYETFFEIYEEWPSPEAISPDRGILIGSPVSKDLCNYYLSYAYHYATERLAKKTCRRGQTKRKRLVNHVIFYADDIVMYSGNKNDLRKAVDMMIDYMAGNLGLTIKPDWILSKTMFVGNDGKEKGGLLDYMGFRFHGGTISTKEYFGKAKRHRETWVTIRRNIFLTGRRKMAAFSRKIKQHLIVSSKFAMGVISSYGWFKNTNMYEYRKEKRVDMLMRIARKIVSDYAKGKEYNEKKYYKMWRRYNAKSKQSCGNGKHSVQGKTGRNCGCVAPC